MPESELKPVEVQIVGVLSFHPLMIMAQHSAFLIELSIHDKAYSEALVLGIQGKPVTFGSSDILLVEIVDAGVWYSRPYISKVLKHWRGGSNEIVYEVKEGT